MPVYILFQTDVHKTRSSRVFCGVFSEYFIAAANATEQGIKEEETEIVECEIERFEEG
jgi:hypothetical protein